MESEGNIRVRLQEVVVAHPGGSMRHFEQRHGAKRNPHRLRLKAQWGGATSPTNPWEQ